MSPAAKPKPDPKQLARDAAHWFDAPMIERCWQAALADWDMEVTISPPEAYLAGQDKDWGGDEPLAYIDMVKRQVVCNFRLLYEIGARDSLPGVLAHELGHHLRFPHTLGLSAALQVLERKLIPGLQSSLTNLFFDLQVNEYVGRKRARELAAVYQGFSARPGGKTTPLFHYYLAIYEELWGLPEGALTSPQGAREMEGNFPGYRADARMFVQTFYALPDVYLQFVYFCSRVLRYLDPSQDAGAGKLPLTGDVPLPDADDYAGALAGNAAMDRALEEAAERGWVAESSAKAAPSDDSALSAINDLANHRPGSEKKEFQESLVSHIYKRLVERHLIKLPDANSPKPDPMLPTITEAWEFGESLRAIDWTQSILSLGELAALQPLKRELEAETPSPDQLGNTAVEIYLDTSGSMPNPMASVNAMTLAAQILSAAAVRKGGQVRGVIYSIGYEKSEWMYNEDVARRFLLRYAGGGTQFPFELFEEFAGERRDVVRVLISDSDFLYNVSAKGAREQFARGLAQTHLFVALLSLWGDPKKELEKALGNVLQAPNFRLAVVNNPQALPQAAARLTEALWGKK